MAVAVPVDGNRLVLPMDHVRAGRMPPVHVAPDACERIVLIVKVIYPVLVEETVRVVHPAVRRSMMIDRTIFLVRDRRRGVGEGYELPCLRRIYPGEMYVALRCAEMLQVEGHAVICLLPFHGQAYIGHIERFSTFLYRKGYLIVCLPDGNDHIPSGRPSAAGQQHNHG